MTESFAIPGLTLSETAQKSLLREGIVEPTAVQLAAVPEVLAGKDVIIQSGTGTGKTLAYLLPLLQRAERDPSLRVLVLAPSPELALQILRTMEAYKSPTLKSASLVGSGNTERQKDKLKKHPQFVVGTPGRVLEMIFDRKLLAKSINVLVLDEIDQILNEQNEAALREIISRPEYNSSFIVASATFGKRAEAFAHDCMSKDRVRLQVEGSPLRQNIQHQYMVFAEHRNELTLPRLIKKLKIDAALVFVHKGYTVAKLFHALQAHQIPCATLSAERSKQQRQEALEDFKSRKVRVLVATDAAARGIDIKDLSWVIHFELANDHQSYQHRAGRTGRAGKNGTSLVMVERGELETLERQAKALRVQFTQLPTLE